MIATTASGIISRRFKSRDQGHKPSHHPAPNSAHPHSHPHRTCKMAAATAAAVVGLPVKLLLDKTTGDLMYMEAGLTLVHFSAQHKAALHTRKCLSQMPQRPQRPGWKPGA